MDDKEEFVRQLEEHQKDAFWYGSVSGESIARLESLLGSRLPASFRAFLSKYGGGGVGQEEISGVLEDNPALEYRGTVYGDTLTCREQFDLPAHLVVVYLDDDTDAVWCLDVGQFEGDECRVVSYDVFSQATKQLASTFDEFFDEYLTLRISR